MPKHRRSAWARPRYQRQRIGDSLRLLRQRPVLLLMLVPFAAVSVGVVELLNLVLPGGDLFEPSTCATLLLWTGFVESRLPRVTPGRGRAAVSPPDAG
jgi:hypothetical protein